MEVFKPKWCSQTYLEKKLLTWSYLFRNLQGGEKKEMERKQLFCIINNNLYIWLNTVCHYLMMIASLFGITNIWTCWKGTFLPRRLQNRWCACPVHGGGTVCGLSALMPPGSCRPLLHPLGHHLPLAALSYTADWSNMYLPNSIGPHTSYGVQIQRKAGSWVWFMH